MTSLKGNISARIDVEKPNKMVMISTNSKKLLGNDSVG
jgi:hypothetical protein